MDTKKADEIESAKLSEGFFQNFFNDSKLAEAQPTLQIIQHRVQEATHTICFRVRLSDGVLSSPNCALDESLREQVDFDGCLDELAKSPVIKILEYQASTINGKKTMVIKKYHLVNANVPWIGNPVSYTAVVGDSGIKASDTPGVSSYSNATAACHPVAAAPKCKTESDKPVAKAVDSDKPVAKAVDSDEPAAKKAGAKRKCDENGKKPTFLETPVKVFKGPSGGCRVIPIKDLSPYLLGKWRIAGVVIMVEDIKEINTKKGPMKCFSFVVTDQHGSSMKITAFAENAIKFHPQVVEKNSYFLSGVPSSLKPANKAYNSTGTDYEIVLQSDSLIEEAPTQIDPPKFVLKKTPLDEVAMHAQQPIDILAVIDKVEEPVLFKTKDGRDAVRRNVYVIDDTATLIAIIFWGEHARQHPYEAGQVIGIKGAFVKQYNGAFTLSINSGTRIEMNIDENDDEDVKHLLEWYQTERETAKIKSVSAQTPSVLNFGDELRTFSAMASPQLLQQLTEDQGQGVYFNVVGMVNSVRRENALYMACPKEGCGKKVNEYEGSYRCDKCMETYPSFKYRYIVPVEVADSVGIAWISLFDEQASKFFGKPAEEMGKLQKEDLVSFNDVIDKKIFSTYSFRCRAKNYILNDVSRRQIQVFDVRPANSHEYGRALDAILEKLENV